MAFGSAARFFTILAAEEEEEEGAVVAEAAEEEEDGAVVAAAASLPTATIGGSRLDSDPVVPLLPASGMVRQRGLLTVNSKLMDILEFERIPHSSRVRPSCSFIPSLTNTT